MLALVALLIAVVGGTASAAGHTTLTVYAASSLTDVLPKVDPAERYSFARLEHARRADHAGRTGGRLRIREPDASGAAVRERAS